MCQGERPGPGCHRHGFTTKRLLLLHGTGLREVEVHKQRWLWPDGSTSHDRPAQDLCWARFSLVVVFSAVWTWLQSPHGLQRTPWPWAASERPSRRTVQRWLARLLEEALDWQVAIRSAVVDQLAPRLIDEQNPAGGIPPPGGISRWKAEVVPRVRQLTTGITLLRSRNMPHPSIQLSVLAEARRRFEQRRHHR